MKLQGHYKDFRDYSKWPNGVHEILIKTCPFILIMNSANLLLNNDHENEIVNYQKDKRLHFLTFLELMSIYSVFFVNIYSVDSYLKFLNSVGGKMAFQCYTQ